MRLLKSLALHFSVNGKRFATELFENDTTHYDNHVISLTAFYSNIFKFLWRSVDGKHVMRFQSEASNFKFLRLSVAEA